MSGVSADRIDFWEDLWRAAHTEKERELLMATARTSGEWDDANIALLRSTYIEGGTPAPSYTSSVEADVEDIDWTAGKSGWSQ